MTLAAILFFAASELVLCFIPGPAVMLVVSQSMRRGVRPAMRGALGILTGNAIYFALSAAGLGALLMASHTLFELVRWAGAGYLVITGLLLIIRRGDDETSDAPAPSDLRSFAQGLITQLSNPKAIVFFTALLPQFIDPNRPVALQFLILGVVSVVIEFPVLLTYALLADRSRHLLGRHTRLMERVAGGLLIGAGVKLAASRA